VPPYVADARADCLRSLMTENKERQMRERLPFVFLAPAIRLPEGHRTQGAFVICSGAVYPLLFFNATAADAYFLLIKNSRYEKLKSEECETQPAACRPEPNAFQSPASSENAGRTS
ncbi:MAG: hypothetical protein PHG54_13120, partial [Smithellaceae bacterium]|nr:hypothetical protein [Smithellaceae bacterium]